MMQNAMPRTNNSFKLKSLCEGILAVWLCFVLVTMLMVHSQPAQAAQIDFGPNGCTLQDAIRSANNDAANGNCTAGSGHDVLVSPDVWSITLNSRLPTITSDLTLTTATASGLLHISGDNDHPVMKITGQDTDVTLSRVWINEGNSATVRGAGIRIEQANVSLSDTIVSFNSTRARYGGGIYIEDGELNVDRSYIEYNSTKNPQAPIAKGGGIYATNSTVNITESRFFYNDSMSRLMTIDGIPQYLDQGYGASVFTDGGTLNISQTLFDEWHSAVHGEQTIASIENSTFHRRQVLDWLDPRGHVFFTDFSSLTLNHVTMKSAFRIENSILMMTNTLLRGECNIGVSTSWIIDTGNLYNTRGFFCPDTGNLFDEPELLNLRDNGGFSETFALNHSSDAIDGGDATYCLPVDQRGVSRTAACDIGAYEAADLIDVAVSGAISEAAPYVHQQAVVYELTVTNDSVAVINELEVDLQTTRAAVTGVNHSLCQALPCVLNGIQPMQSITIPVAATLSANFDDFEFLAEVNSTANSTYTETNLNNNVHTLNGLIEEGADLQVDMQLLSQNSHFIGEVIEYQIEVENLGFDTATNTQVELSLSGLSLLSFSGCDSSAGLQCQLGSMLNQSSRQIGVQAQVTAAVFDAAAEVESLVYDPDLDNNLDDQGNNGALGETNISVSVAPLFDPPYYSYGYIQLQVKITTGADPATNIRVWEYFPGSEFIGCSEFWNIAGYCEVASIPADTTKTLVFDYFNPITATGAIENHQYWVFAAPGETDTDLSNNEAIVDLDIEPVADLAAQLSHDHNPPYFSGQELEFQLRVVNGGLNHATDVELDVVPDNMTLEWMSGQYCQTESCQIGLFERFAEDNLILVYRVDEPGAIGLDVSVTADQADQNLNNNTDGFSDTADMAENDLIFTDDFE